MPEIKKNFVKGKMNKDLDERLVPDGEYRDALNIQVATSEGSDVGTVQNLMGVTRRSNTNSRYAAYGNSGLGTTNGSFEIDNPWNVDEGACVTVGAVVNPANDTIIQLQHAHLKVITTGNTTDGFSIQYLDQDRILEYNTVTTQNTPVLVDNFRTRIAIQNTSIFTTTSNVISYNLGGGSGADFSSEGVRIGMTVKCFAGSSGTNAWTNSSQTSTFIHEDVVVKVVGINGAGIQIKATNHLASTAWTEDSTIKLPANAHLVFEADRVLNFEENKLITGINIVDGVLFFTDNHSEPKKIHIERFKSGSLGDYNTHSMLYCNGILQDGTSNKPLTYVQEQHVTVVKKSPLFPPTLQLSDTTRSDGASVINTVSSFHPIYSSATITAAATITTCDANYVAGYDFGSSDFGFLYNPTTGTGYVIDDDPLVALPEITILVPGNSDYEFLAQDNVILSANSVSNGLAKTHEVRAKVITPPTAATASTNPHECYAFQEGLQELELQLTSIASDIPLDKDDIISWDVKLDQEKEAMFRFKFPRFAYRWKYEDGEYSCFSPFTEAAFVPSKFDYIPRKGFNLGMTNEVRLLHLKDFVNSETPSDVVEIDLLYKESDLPNIYTVKSIKKEVEFTSNSTTQITPSDLEWSNDLLSIESDLIYATIDSTQLLRPFDVVPRKALGQEIIANRLVFANYLQGYDLISEAGYVVTPKFDLSVGDVVYNNPDLAKFSIDAVANARMPERSIKSLRTYQVGIVYKDKYGRETPVITNHNNQVTMSLYVEKLKAARYNQLVVDNHIHGSLQHPEWADSFKFFIKETSNEYYNLAMDRWYPAEDGNVWLSFPSSEGSKVDLETFLILKKQHDNDTPVLNKARYKILALESNPPEFITKKKFSYGSLSTSFSSTGQPSTDATFVDINYASFSSTGLNGSIFPVKQANLLLRITSATAKSFWYDINDITEIGSNVRITIGKSFGVDMGFAGDGSGVGAGNPALSLEIVQERKERDEEFAGRFFAKIHRDVDLETNVLHQTEEQDFIVTDTLRYTALNVSELDYNPNVALATDKIRGYESDSPAPGDDDDQWSYQLLQAANATASSDYGHKQYLDPVDIQLVKQFWNGDRAGAAGNTNALAFNQPATSANGITGDGYARGDSWKRFSWFIDSQWGENPIRNGISYVASRSYDYGENLTVSEIGAFDSAMNFGMYSTASTTNVLLSEHGFIEPAVLAENHAGIKIFDPSSILFGVPTNHNGFSDVDAIDIDVPSILSPNSSQVADVYRNLDRNEASNVWIGFSNPDLYTSPGNYPRVENSQNLLGLFDGSPSSANNGYEFDFPNVDRYDNFLSGKYETVDKENYITGAGAGAYKFTAQHDDTIVKINTQIQVRPSLDCDPDHPTVPYGSFTSGDPSVYNEAYGADYKELVEAHDTFEVFSNTNLSSNQSALFINDAAVELGGIFSATNNAQVTNLHNRWFFIREANSVSKSGAITPIYDSTYSLEAGGPTAKKNIVIETGNTTSSERLAGLTQQVHTELGSDYTVTLKLKSDYVGSSIHLFIADGTAINSQVVSIGNGKIVSGGTGVFDTATHVFASTADDQRVGFYIKTLDTNASDIVEIESFSVKKVEITSSQNTSLNLAAISGSKKELHIPVNTPLPGQTFRGTLQDPSVYDAVNNAIATGVSSLNTLITSGGVCPGCMHTGNINNTTPASMSSLGSNVGGLTGINVRLKIHHNNTSFTENKASGTVIDDQSTGFVPEQMGNALHFAKISDLFDEDIEIGNAVMVRGDHFFAKNDYHLQIILAAVEEIKLNKGESVWLEVESYEKEFNYKHYIGSMVFEEIQKKQDDGVFTQSFIQNNLALNWSLSDSATVNLYAANDIAVSIAQFNVAQAHYRFRGNYGGPIEIVEGNESFCNLDQDFVHDLETPDMISNIANVLTGSFDFFKPNSLGKIKYPVWGGAYHPRSKWSTGEEGIGSYFSSINPTGTGSPIGASDDLWHETFLTKDRDSRLFGGIALPAGFGNDVGDEVITSINRQYQIVSEFNGLGQLSPITGSAANFFIRFGRSHIFELNGGYHFSAGISPKNVINTASPIDRIPKKLLTQLQLDQFHEDSTALRDSGQLSIDSNNQTILKVASSMFNHQHPAIYKLSATDDLNDEDIKYLAGNSITVGGTNTNNSDYDPDAWSDRHVFKAMSSGNFINFTFQFDPTDVSHTYGYPLLFPFHKINNGANYNYDPSIMPVIGNWNLGTTDHEDTDGWVGTRIAIDDATVTINANHTYTPEVFNSDLDVNGDLYSSKKTSYRVDRANSPTAANLSNALDIISVQIDPTGATSNSIEATHVGQQIVEFDDGGLSVVGGMFKVDTRITDVSLPYFSTPNNTGYWVDVTLSKLPNMTAPYSGTSGLAPPNYVDPRITLINRNADVLLHPTPWKDDLRGTYFPPEENGKINNDKSWYNECYHNICSAIPNIVGSRDFTGYGLHDAGKKLHFSFGGINNLLENWRKNAYNISLFHPELSTNLWNLKTVGSFFRFKDDPNSCIFKIVSSINSFDQNTNGIGIRNYMPAYENDSEEDFDHPSFNATHNIDDVKDPYNKRVRFYLGIEYTGWNTHYGKLPDGSVGVSSDDNYIQNLEAETTIVGIGHLDGQTSVSPGDFPEVTHNPALGSVSNPVTSNLFSGGRSFDQGELYSTIEFVAPDWDGSEDFTSANPAIWETEPKEDLDLDIYYEASPSYPTKLTATSVENYFRVNSSPNASSGVMVTAPGLTANISLSYVYVEGDEVILGFNATAIANASITLNLHPVLRFTSQDGSYVEAKIKRYYYGANNWLNKASVEVLSPTDPDTKFGLPYFNCFSFGNGVESDRIRDDFNKVTIGKGVKASTTKTDQYKEERRKNSLIFSGIYNSNTGINKLNQFISLDDITKELNPTYGGIQKLYARDTDLIAFCEDKVLRILANKDALYNADGNFQLISNKNVLGQAVPYTGEYGIAKHPESFASYGYRSYFVDADRGCVLRLSKDGIEVISDYGMKSWFRDRLRLDTTKLVGGYDPYLGNYDITLKASGETSKTLSFSERAKGWVSFKSYIPSDSVHLNSSYYTYKFGDIFEHHSNHLRNNFYPTFSAPNIANHYNSTVDFIFNDAPDVVKAFRTLNYEGSAAKITAHAPASVAELADGVSYHSHDGSKPPSGYGEYYNNTSSVGWSIQSISTNLQEGSAIEFKNKEGKYFAAIKGETTTEGNVDSREFSVQGIGNAISVEDTTAATGAPQEYSLSVSADCWQGVVPGCMDPTSLANYNPAANADDGSCCYISGCMIPFALDFDQDACVDSSPTSCTGFTWGCTDVAAFNYNGSNNWPDGTIEPIVACTGNSSDPSYCCCYTAGCIDPTALNYDPNACSSDGSCIYPIYGCTDATALNYWPGANTDDGTCIWIAGCTTADPGFYPDNNGHGVLAVYDCGYTYLGGGVYAGPNTSVNTPTTTDPCTFPCSSDGTVNGTPQGYASQNFIPCAGINDGSCVASSITPGCTTSTALNYSNVATIDNGTCCFVQGCMDDTEGPYANYVGACRDGFVPGSVSAIANNALATDENQCNYSCTSNGSPFTQCGWTTFNTFNPNACNNSSVGVLNNPGNINYNIVQPEYSAAGPPTGTSITTNIANDASNAAGVINGYSWCFTPTATGCFDLSPGSSPDVYGNCRPGELPPGGGGGGNNCTQFDPNTSSFLPTGYAAINVSAPDWCLDPTTLIFPYGNSGRANTALASYVSVNGNCPGHNQSTCVIAGCIDPIATNYNPLATIQGSTLFDVCIIPALNCPATNLYWPSNTLNSSGKFLTPFLAQAYEPVTNVNIANFYSGSNVGGTVSLSIAVEDQVFEHLMDGICTSSGGLDPVLYGEVTPSGTTCASCIYQGWDSATTTLQYCDSYKSENNWSYMATSPADNCLSFLTYTANQLGPDNRPMNYRDNELSIPWMPPTNEGATSIGNNDHNPALSTKVGGPQNNSNPFWGSGRRDNVLGEVSAVLSHVEYLNMDGHLVNENLKTRDMIRLKELSLYQNFVGYLGFEENSTAPKILDLHHATDLKRLNFGNERYNYLAPAGYSFSNTYNNISHPTYDSLLMFNIHRDLLAEPVGWQSNPDPVGYLRGDGADGLGVRGPDGYLQGDAGYLHGYNHTGGFGAFYNGYVTSFLEKFYGNSVHHGFVDADAGATGYALFDWFGSSNNIINYILTTPGNNAGDEFINLEYLNINNQEYSQIWEQFQLSTLNVNHMVDTDPRIIHKRQVQLNLEHCTDLQELHIQGTAVPSIYVNNGFETGYYPNSYQGLSTDPNETKFLSNDFAYHPNLKVVDARNSQLFAHVNFAYNSKLEKLYVGRGLYSSRMTDPYNSFDVRIIYQPNIGMIDPNINFIALAETPSAPHYQDTQTILVSKDAGISPPTFDFKVNPTSLKVLEIVNEKVGGSSNIESLDRKGSGMTTYGCHNCDVATENIYGPLTGNSAEQLVRMDIGNPLELVSLQNLENLDIRVWTNGAVAVNNTSLVDQGTPNRGKSHIYFGRAPVTFTSSSHGAFSITTLHYDRSISNILDDIEGQSEIYGLDQSTLAATGIVPGARLDRISYDGGTSWQSTTDVDCYVVSVNGESIKLSSSIGAIATTFKSPAFANVNNGTVTQGNQGSNIVYGVNSVDSNEVTITGSDLQLYFTMENPDWGNTKMNCTIAGSQITVPSGSYGLYPQFDAESHHPVVIGQMSITSDIVLHFGSQNNMDSFVNAAGITIGLYGKVMSAPTNLRYSFRGYEDNPKIQFETQSTDNVDPNWSPFSGVHPNANINVERFQTNIYCVV